MCVVDSFQCMSLMETHYGSSFTVYYFAYCSNLFVSLENDFWLDDLTQICLLL